MGGCEGGQVPHSGTDGRDGHGLDLPAWEAPYVLRDARLGYLNGYESAVISGDMSEQQISYAAEARWGERWREKLRGCTREVRVAAGSSLGARPWSTSSHLYHQSLRPISRELYRYSRAIYARRPPRDAEGQGARSARNALAVHLTPSVLIRGPKHRPRMPGPFSQPGWLHTPRVRAVLCMNWPHDVAILGAEQPQPVPPRGPRTDGESRWSERDVARLFLS